MVLSSRFLDYQGIQCTYMGIPGVDMSPSTPDGLFRIRVVCLWVLVVISLVRPSVYPLFAVTTEVVRVVCTREEGPDRLFLLLQVATATIRRLCPAL